MPDYDAIVVGAGNNGMSCATILAKGGLKVLSLEKNEVVGGLGSTREIFKGYKHNSGAWAMMFCPKRILEEFTPEKYGWETVNPGVFLSNMGTPGEKPFMMYNDVNQLLDHVKNDHGEDAVEGLAKVFGFFSTFAAGMDAALYNPPVSISAIMEAMPSVQAKDALRTCFYGRLSDIIDQFFDPKKHHNIKGLIAAYANDGCWMGPYEIGSAYSASFHFAHTGMGSFAFLPKGGMGHFTEAIARLFKEKKGELRLNSPVKRVLLEKGKAIGVELQSGEKISAKVVASNCDAYATMIKLVGEEHLPADYAKMVKDIKYRNPFMQAYMCLKELPEFVGDLAYLNKSNARWSVSRQPSMEALQRGMDRCRFNEIPKVEDMLWAYYIPSVHDETMAPKGRHCMHLYLNHYPVMAPDEQQEGIREEFYKRAIANICKYAPNMESAITDRVLFGPLDYEKKFGNTRGDFCHGTFEIASMMDFRPVPGWTNWNTPVKNLYLCGSATHPGWGVSAIPGWNCGHKILKDWKK